MRIDEAAPLLFAGLAGGALGAFFFGGLWWTLRRGLSSGRPALWHLASLLLRMAVTLLGFYAIGGGRWERLLACLLGFVMARMVVTRMTRGVGRAPQP